MRALLLIAALWAGAVSAADVGPRRALLASYPSWVLPGIDHNQGSVDMYFSTGQYYSVDQGLISWASQISDSRASAETCWGSPNTLVALSIAPNNSPCITAAGLAAWESRTNLFLNSATLSTQSVSVSGVPYSVSFYGTGTITFSGAYTGSLAGTGVNSYVTTTFTPSAGTVTATVSGTVNDANFEAGGFSTPWIPTTGSTATRAADNISAVSGGALDKALRVTPGSVFAQTNAVNFVTSNKIFWFSGAGTWGEQYQPSNTVQIFSNGTTITATAGGQTVAGRAKTSLKYNNTNDSIVFGSGSVVTGADSGRTTNATGTIYLGDNGAGTRELNGYIERVAVAPNTYNLFPTTP
jgi:hypothetical protein